MGRPSWRTSRVSRRSSERGSTPVVVLLMATAVVAIAADYWQPSTFDAMRRSALMISEPVREGIDDAAYPIVGAWHGATGGYAKTIEENERLWFRVGELEGEPSRVVDLEHELLRVGEATDLAFVENLSAMPARVIVNRRSPSGAVLEIDKGTTDGIRIGMPVVTGSGLVGTIALASEDRSVVRPITDIDTKVGVRSLSHLGLVSGRGSGDNLGLELDPTIDMDLSDGTRLVTSGLDRSLFPDNLPVGVVVTNEAGEREVEPLVAFDQLGYVSVLGWEPAP